jgi:predicted RNA-binding protein with PIN domain
MAHIIIDGYNVTGIHHGNMEAARDGLLQALKEYNASRRHAITVVFDGWKDGPGAQQSRVSGGIRTVFSALGVLADTVIKSMVDGPVPRLGQGRGTGTCRAVPAHPGTRPGRG